MGTLGLCPLPPLLSYLPTEALMGPGVAALPHCRLPGTESSGREVSPLLSATGLLSRPWEHISIHGVTLDLPQSGHRSCSEVLGGGMQAACPT